MVHLFLLQTGLETILLFHLLRLRIQICCTLLLSDRWALLGFHILIDMMFHKLSQCIESNAFSKSMKCVYRVAFHSLTFSDIFLRVKIWSMVLLFSRNPACSFLKMLSTPFLILLINTLPKILLMTGKSVIPLQFVHSRKLLFFGNFTIRPLFHLVSATPSSFTSLDNFVNSFALSSKSIFRSSTTMLSWPAAFPLFVDLIAFFTCWLECPDVTLSFCLVSVSCGCIGLRGGSLFSTVSKYSSRSSVFHFAHLLIFHFYRWLL